MYQRTVDGGVDVARQLNDTLSPTVAFTDRGRSAHRGLSARMRVVDLIDSLRIIVTAAILFDDRSYIAFLVSLVVCSNGGVSFFHRFRDIATFSDCT